MRHPDAPEPEEPWGTSEERSRKPWWGKLAKPREVPDPEGALDAQAARVKKFVVRAITAERERDAAIVRAENAEALLRDATGVLAVFRDGEYECRFCHATHPKHMGSLGPHRPGCVGIQIRTHLDGLRRALAGIDKEGENG